MPLGCVELEVVGRWGSTEGLVIRCRRRRRRRRLNPGPRPSGLFDFPPPARY